MSAILNSSNAHNFSFLKDFNETHIKFMVHRALSYKTYIYGLRSPLNVVTKQEEKTHTRESPPSLSGLFIRPAIVIYQSHFH